MATEAAGLVKAPAKPICTPYQKAEAWHEPDSKSGSAFGGSGVQVKLGDKTTADVFVAGKTTSSDTDGYLIDGTLNHTWRTVDSPFGDVSFGSQARLRHLSCGTKNEQLRLTPLKLSLATKSPYCPIDEVYAYPAYATGVVDNKFSERNLRFGSLAGISKKITANSSLYAEVQADTSDERFLDSSWGFTLGFKRTF